MDRARARLTPVIIAHGLSSLGLWTQWVGAPLPLPIRAFVNFSCTKKLGLQKKRNDSRLRRQGLRKRRRSLRKNLSLIKKAFVKKIKALRG